MAKETVGEIRINKRIVRIGHQVYPLANISRVQTLRLVWGGRLGTFHPLRTIAILLLVVGAIVGVAEAVVPRLHLDLESGLDIETTARHVAVGAVVLGGIWTAYSVGVLFYRLLIRRPRYALVIETAGTQYTALTGTDYYEINRITGEIVAAIEDPPFHERIVHINGDVVMGDKVGRDKHQQVGADNRMTFDR